MQKAQSGHGARPLLWFGVALPVAALWLLFTWSLQIQARLVGLAATGLATWFLVRNFAEELDRYSFRFADLASCWRLPWYVLSSSWEIVVVLARDLAGVETAPSLFRVCGFRTAKDNPVLVARRALATAYTSVAPNFIVIGIDYNQSRMLFHQIRRSEIPLMTQQLGAKVSHDPSRHAPPPADPS